VAGRLVRRLLDFTVGSIVLLLSFPNVALLALLIKLASEGPVFIKLVRVGKHGNQFTRVKLLCKHRTRLRAASSRCVTTRD
jgi:lipopolysaccharide/colanic/teichoic acid biosynthesis glycosyltransferase